jgi:hypothetical protein
VLRLAADENFNNDIVRGLLRRNVSTLSKHAYDRIEAGRAMPGVFETMAVGRAIDDLLLLIECSFDGEWEGQVRYLPL